MLTLSNTYATPSNKFNPLLGGKICMKGDIYSRQKCTLCDGRLVHNEKRDGCFCPVHPQCGATKFFVRFGKVFKNFSYYLEAYHFLQGLRFKYIEGTFDARDYQKNAPLGFKTLSKKYIKMKEQQGLRSISNVRNYMRRACNYWDQKNIKTFNRADIREFLYHIENITEKTRHNYMSCLRDFFRNLVEDEVIDIIKMPRMPKIEYELGYRTITDMETQTAILEKIYELSYNLNPKIWLGCDMLSLYTNIRTKDLLNLNEVDIDAKNGILEIKRPTKKKNKKLTLRLIDEHILEIRELKKRHPGMPHLPFFRHVSGISGVQANEPFGEKYFYKWWKMACEELGIKGLDLYGGTRHTTTTALAKKAGKENAKKASGHETNKAFERYCQYQDDDTFELVRIAAEMKGKVIEFEEKAQK
jgi:integrase